MKKHKYSNDNNQDLSMPKYFWLSKKGKKFKKYYAVLL
jgi:hypothetical protein